jgi:hypothetical protein
MYDEFQTIAAYGQPAVCILGNPATSEFLLVDLAPGPLPADLRQTADAHGLYFIGAAGLVHGAPRTALAEPLDNATVDALAQAVIAFIMAGLEARINASMKPKNDFERFAENLIRLPDNRQ